MQEIYFTPGPTQLHPIINNLLGSAAGVGIASISHRSVKYEKIHAGTVDALRELLSIPSSHLVFFVSSGTEAMERVVENISPGRSFHFINGDFSRRFYSAAQDLRRDPQYLAADSGEGFNLAEVQIPDDARLVCLTQNETSTGVALPEADLHNLRRRYPDKLFAVDIVSSCPISRLDFEVIDCAFFSVQKCFGLPAGLGVLIVSNDCIARAHELSASGFSVGSYHNFKSLAQYATRNQTPETPNVLAIYLLGEVCREYLRQGLNNIRARIENRAADLYSFFEKHAFLSPFVEDSKFRSKTVLAIDTAENANELKNYLGKQGMQVGLGYGIFSGSHIRIANFPTHSDEDFVRLTKALADFEPAEDLGTLEPDSMQRILKHKGIEK